jgi:hypothetical protein
MTAKTHHRWLSFKLRSLFVVTTLIAVAVGWIAYERNKSRRQLEIIAALGRSAKGVEFAGPYDDADGDALDQSWWRRLSGKVLGPRVRHIRLGYRDLNGLPSAPEFTSLRGLYIDSPRVSDLSFLAELTDLRDLFIDGMEVDVELLGRLTKLERLRLGGAQLGDLSPLCKLTNLEMLSLFGMDVSDEQISELQQALPDCHIFYPRLLRGAN